MTELADAHIRAQWALRTATEQVIARAWERQPSYDEADVAGWQQAILPVVLGSQIQSAALTNAFLAGELERPPLPLDITKLTAAAVRGGTSPAEVYRRPFVEVWTALRDGVPWADAVKRGRDRATGAAATDVQLSMRATLREVGQLDELILGYARKPDPDACDFCKLVAGRRYTVEQLLPIHTRCGCGVEVITAANRHLYTGNPDNDLALPAGGTVAVEEHGELGPVLVNADHAFTAL